MTGPPASRPPYPLAVAGLLLLLGGLALEGWPAWAAGQGGLGLVLAGALLHALRAAEAWCRHE